MSIVVQKYGGSSVADLDRLRLVAERVVRTAALGHQVVVVVSAMGKTTDELIARARAVWDPPPRRELDMLISCGERISMSLLCMAIQALGRDAISFTGSQSGIITDERHAGARVLEVRPVRIRQALDRGQIVIVAGFQGVSLRKEVTTLGRGGSDTTAVALAAALGAGYCEICSDVDGVQSADPRVVPEARKLDRIGYEEMQELAIHGAKVLNAQAVEWARRAGIRIDAVATAGGGTGTAVDGGAPPEGGDGAVGAATPNGPETTLKAARATSVTGSRDLIRLRGRGLAHRASEVWAALARDGVPLRTVGVAGVDFVLTIPRTDLPDWDAVRARLAATFGGALEVEDALGSVTVVGHGVGESAALLGEMHDTVARAGGSVLGLEATPLRVTFVVPPASVDAVVRALHARLIGG